MKKLFTTLVFASLLSVTSVAPVFADAVYGMSVFNPLWPVATALSLPASIIANLVSPGANVPVVVPTLPLPAPVVYQQPVPYYYAPRVYVGPGYYAPRYYAPRAYYPPGRVYRNDW
jgi:hypothetical protein